MKAFKNTTLVKISDELAEKIAEKFGQKSLGVSKNGYTTYQYILDKFNKGAKVAL